MSDAGAPDDLLEERPDLADPLEAVLDVDQRQETWTFEDIPINSGPFGELVSRGVVEKNEGEYRVADPTAVRAALGYGDGQTVTNDLTPNITMPSVSLQSVDRQTTTIVTAALALVALVRLHVFQSVYRDGQVILSGNDPYYYRYWVEQALASGPNPFDLSALATLPGAVQNGEPLLVATLWWVAELLGSGPEIAGHVLAWYPIVSAVLTAVLVYLLAVRVTDDRRVGVAAVLILALVPFDAKDLRRPRAIAWGLGLGVAVAGQVLAWEAGPLTLHLVQFLEDNRRRIPGNVRIGVRSLHRPIIERRDGFHVPALRVRRAVPAGQLPHPHLDIRDPHLLRRSLKHDLVEELGRRPTVRVQSPPAFPGAVLRPQPLIHGLVLVLEDPV